MSRASQLVRTARLEAGLTQAELGRRAGMTQSMIARMESGTSNPTVASLDHVLSTMNRQLNMGPAKLLPELDEGQILEQLKVTPLRRLVMHDGSRRNLRAMLRVAKRVPR
jgi:transcriptional regulator with XRE-family HTH domain